ncbi:hypothetical protein J4G02_13425 [Candidatus Poribacteria bacterium]|nr:hypothetical protein [Candidatus Poribacteria bacterium]
MTERQKETIEALVTELQQETLTEANLRKGIADIVGADSPKRQDVLYLQAVTTSPGAAVVGMLLVEDGELREGPPNPEDWPYQTVLEAVQDGWRIISFPNMALLAVDEKEFYGLGAEFILERWR